MDPFFYSFLSRHAGEIPQKSIQAVLDLVAEGATVPFIARYRKEKTGNLDEVQIRSVIEGHETFQEIVKRKTFLLKEIGDQGNLTEEIKKRIDSSWELGELEEIYRPFKKKKKTKATLAREAGLDTLAQWIWDVGHNILKDDTTMEMKAKAYLNPQLKIVTYEEALKGAQDILVEKIANDPDLRAAAQNNYLEKGIIITKAAKGYKPNSKYEMYKEFSEPVTSLKETKNSHRYLALKRGWQEEELSVEVKADEDYLIKKFQNFATPKIDDSIGAFLANCSKIALNVYVIPSVTNEVHRILKERADEDAIKVFVENVRKVLLASPFGAKCVLGVDPGLRTGCKVALIDKAGNFISHTVLQILGEQAEEKAKQLFAEVTKQIQIDAIAVGNGTAGRQTEVFLRKIFKELSLNIPIVMINESGASVYSASEIARTEFPDLDVTVKGAISIARRLQDPLAELVKVDPKSIGVGQYQHDISQTQLKKSLEAVVESCVNNVGVDLNTASTSLLSFVSGIGPALAQNIVDFRKSKGLFSNREDLLKVPKFSNKVYEQAAGFLRILGGKVVLDSTGIHPERYQAVRDMAHDLNLGLSELIGEGAKKLLAQRTKWAQLVGEFTFDDIVKELEKPGRDPRDPFKIFQFRDDIFEVKDLVEGMICPGIVTNVTNFGAFVDVGVHQDGLVHISEISHQFVDDPRKVLSPGDQVKVKVLKVDKEKNQISFSMKLDAPPVREQAPRPVFLKKTERSSNLQQDSSVNQRDHQRGRQKERSFEGKSDSSKAYPQRSRHPEGQSGKGQQEDRHSNFKGKNQGGTPGGGKPNPKPFNNPFAALANLGLNQKK